MVLTTASSASKVFVSDAETTGSPVSKNSSYDARILQISELARGLMEDTSAAVKDIMVATSIATLINKGYTASSDGQVAQQQQ